MSADHRDDTRKVSLLEAVIRKHRGAEQGRRAGEAVEEHKSVHFRKGSFTNKEYKNTISQIAIA